MDGKFCQIDLVYFFVSDVSSEVSRMLGRKIPFYQKDEYYGDCFTPFLREKKAILKCVHLTTYRHVHSHLIKEQSSECKTDLWKHPVLF